MNILGISILVFLSIYLLVFNKRITYTTLRIILLFFICISLAISLLVRFKPNKSIFYEKCFIDENKNRLGPGKCYFDSDCRGNRKCSNKGNCVGKSNC